MSPIEEPISGEAEEPAGLEAAVVQTLDVQILKQLGARLRNIGMEAEANEIEEEFSTLMITTGWDIRTIDNRQFAVEYLEAKHRELLKLTDALKAYGKEKQADALLNYDPLITDEFPNIESRIQKAEDLLTVYPKKEEKKEPVSVEDELTRLYAFSIESQLRPQSDYEESTEKAIEVLEGQTGILELNKDIDTIIIPDLHARREFLVAVLAEKDAEGLTNLEKLRNGKLQIICLGDGMHSEGKVGRWLEANDEITGTPENTPNFDEEMLESLGTMKMIMDLIAKYPENFHYIKGNHDNILNRRTDGDLQYIKYLKEDQPGEGEIVKMWIRLNFGETFLKKWYRFEKRLPIFFKGYNYAGSHSEPGNVFYSRPKEKVNITMDDIDNKTADAVEALTWSRDEFCDGNQADKVLEMAGYKPEEAYYLVGHSAQTGKYLKIDNRVIRLHNAYKYNYAFIPKDGSFNPEKHIYEAKPTVQEKIPPDLTDKDRQRYRALEEKYKNIHLGDGQERVFKNPQGAIEIKFKDKTLEIVHEDDHFWLVNPQPDDPKANKSILIPELGHIPVGRRYQEKWFTNETSPQIGETEVEVKRLGKIITVKNVCGEEANVREHPLAA